MVALRSRERRKRSLWNEMGGGYIKRVVVLVNGGVGS